VFSDPAYQAMYEAFIEEGVPHEQAVKAVREFIESLKRKEIEVDIWKKLPKKEPEPYYPRPDKWVKWDTPKQDDWKDTPFDKFRIVYGDIAKMAVSDAEDAIKDIKDEVRSWMRSTKQGLKYDKRWQNKSSL